MKIYTEIMIQAPPGRVWEVFSDFERYSDWNPFISRVEPEPAVGSIISITLGGPGGRPMVFKPRVLVYEATRELRWLGRLYFPGLVDGEHYFQLEAVDGATRFIHGEHFRGILVPFVGKTLRSARKGFVAMNEALKQRCENAV